eukprot:409542-Amphidinium_carterae.1
MRILRLPANMSNTAFGKNSCLRFTSSSGTLRSVSIEGQVKSFVESASANRDLPSAGTLGAPILDVAPIHSAHHNL